MCRTALLITTDENGVDPRPNLHDTAHMGHALHGLGRTVPVGVCASKRRAAAAVLALLLLVLATTTKAQASERLWTVTCGLPQQDNPILDLLPRVDIPALGRAIHVAGTWR